MLVSVAICTWNRSALLRETLEALTMLSVPPEVDWELLVVDNGCTDDTGRVLAAYRDRLPLRPLHQPVVGLARARNTAVEAAAGDYIVWTDDDVAPEPGWLSAYVRAFRRFSDAACFGGPVQPWFIEGAPGWLLRAWPDVALYYAVRECAEEPAPILPQYVPFGANFALRRDVQLRHPYDPSLGRRGAGLYSGEDWEVIQEILRRGGTGWWVPEARVHHALPAHRLTVSYLREVTGCQGELGALMAPDLGSRRVLNRPLWVVGKAVGAEARYRFHRAFSGPEVWVRHMLAASLYRGQLRGYGLARRP